MNRVIVAFSALWGVATFAHATSPALQVGEQLTRARVMIFAEGWRADPGAHSSSGPYMGLERQLVEGGFLEVDYCSVGKSFCVLQYAKGKACLRLYTQGEQVRRIKVERWSDECRERGPDEPDYVLPADVRYVIQWSDDCDNAAECRRTVRLLRQLKKKYAGNAAILRTLNDLRTKNNW